MTRADAILREVLPRLTSAETSAAKLRAEAQQINVDLPELDRIDETIARIRDLSMTDPMAIPTDARGTLDEAIHNAGEVVARSRASHDALAADITAASDLIDTCRELIERATQSRSVALEKIAQPQGLRHPPSMQAIDGERGLAAKLQPILASTEPWQVVRRRIDSWSASATRLRDQLQRVAEANARPLKTRDELRGRLNAFRAKMAATGFSEDLVLADMSAEAHNELFTSPTDLVRAERLVSEFGDRLATP